MKRTTIFIDESHELELHTLARRNGVPVSALVRESLAQYLADQQRKRGLTLRFLGRGRSGQKHIAERHEELLWGELAPHRDKAKRSRRRRG